MALETPKGASFTIWNPGRDSERKQLRARSKTREDGESVIEKMSSEEIWSQ